MTNAGMGPGKARQAGIGHTFSWTRKALRRLSLANSLPILAFLIGIPGAVVAILQLRSAPTVSSSVAQQNSTLTLERSPGPELPPAETGKDSDQKAQLQGEEPDGNGPLIEQPAKVQVAKLLEPHSQPPTPPAHTADASPSEELRHKDSYSGNESSTVSFAIAPENREQESDRISAEALQAELEREAVDRGVFRRTLDAYFASANLFLEAKSGRTAMLAQAGAFSKVDSLVLGTVSSRCNSNPVQDGMSTCHLLFVGIRATEHGGQGAVLRIRSSGAGFDEYQAIESAARKLVRGRNREWFNVIETD